MKKGVTLTEVLIVISVIAFLVIVGTAYLRSQIFKADDAKKKADVRRIGIAAEEYEKDHDCYPLSTDVVCNPGTGLRPYLDKIPCDSKNGASYYYEHEDSQCPGWYKFYVKLENTSDPDYQAGIGPGGIFSYVYSSSNAPLDVSLDVPVPSGSTPPPSQIPDVNYYGCFSGVCRGILWDTNRPGPECDPNFQNTTCYGQCIYPENECKSW